MQTHTDFVHTFAKYAYSLIQTHRDSVHMDSLHAFVKCVCSLLQKNMDSVHQSQKKWLRFDANTYGFCP